MCIGIPMQVVQVQPGFVHARGRGEVQRLCTALIGPRQPGDWVLAFLGQAREAISAERAAEVNAVLDLLAGAVGGPGAQPGADPPGFPLPSAMGRDELAQLAQSAQLAGSTPAAPTA